MVHVVQRSEDFLPFPIDLKPGKPISEQLVYAVEKAVISGVLRPGARFPSIRAISKDLRIHPNTTQKAITVLIDEGFLQVHPGIGTVISDSFPGTVRSAEAIRNEAESLILQAKRMRMSLEDLKRIIDAQWSKLTND